MTSRAKKADFIESKQCFIHGSGNEKGRQTAADLSPKEKYSAQFQS